MGLDELHLRVLATSSDDEKEKKDAQKGVVFIYHWHTLGLRARYIDNVFLVLNLLERGKHWVLVVCDTLHYEQ